MGDFTIMCNFICSACFVRRFLFLFYISHIGFEPITMVLQLWVVSQLCVILFVPYVLDEDFCFYFIFSHISFEPITIQKMMNK
jgi:hypothetical protein